MRGGATRAAGFSHLWKTLEGKAEIYHWGSGGDKVVMGGGWKRSGQGFPERETSTVNTLKRRHSYCCGKNLNFQRGGEKKTVTAYLGNEAK